MKNLSLETKGVKGGETKTQEKIGYILASFDGQRISIDNFKGRGNSYKQRKKPLIEITQDGTSLFLGTFEELKSKL